ncbi:MAG: glycogen/starch/alpha-glucan phosphorylase [Ruminococcaceae bacterium]|nr:glycogen/starch/alpha-glucan phosphorylase [Oscillospiraceae bacterium]
MNYKLTKKQAKEMLENRLLHFFGVSTHNATNEQYYRAIAMILRDMMTMGRGETVKKSDETGKKNVYYLSMEFLMGRSLKNNLYNLNLTDTFKSVLKDLGVKLDDLYECEPDAGLGNGGLGRLAACYLDGLATQGYSARGYSILYEYGIFRQKLIDGKQTELPDNWLPGGDVWLVPRESSSVDITFEGTVKDTWENQYHHVEIENGTVIKAIPYDMFVPGKDGKCVSILRLWTAKAPEFDMKLFNEGDYIRSMERQAMAEVISKVLYPSDNHPEGKALRLRQQYFLVSASVQDIVRHHLRVNGTLDNFSDRVAIHINDTHPTMAIPELMRILLDECGYSWDDAWSIVTKTMAYTNHTVMSEALECWSEELVKRLIPRVYEIIKEIDNRFRSYIWESTHDADYVERTAIISGGVVRMANLCVATCHSVNGVSGLHSQILKDSLFNDFYRLMPDKFTNVTNGIAHRRWLCQANPRLSSYLKELLGNDKFVYDADNLSKLNDYKNDKDVLNKLAEIKMENKKDFADFIKKTTGQELDVNSIFDVQVKRLHEYKRQHLNAFNIVLDYLTIKENPDAEFTPHTYIFGAKAAPGYHVAQRIISFILALADLINNDPDVKGRLKVLYVEDYNVSNAEKLMPAADVSEQISLAGKEASGTGNMKLMMNGAITIGTLDGANVEIHESVGDDNMFLFGMRTEEVNSLRSRGYDPMNYYNNNEDIRKVLDFISRGINGQNFSDISGTIMHHDPFMVLADFADYRRAQQKMVETFKDKKKWNQMMLSNIANSGRFAADRAINEYAKDIWNAQKI